MARNTYAERCSEMIEIGDEFEIVLRLPNAPRHPIKGVVTGKNPSTDPMLRGQVYMFFGDRKDESHTGLVCMYASDLVKLPTASDRLRAETGQMQGALAL